MKIRYPAVQGTFYPSDNNELENMLDDFDRKVQVNAAGVPKALIVPHAGLVYSGLTAAYAYKYAAGHKYRSAVIFAPSHRVAFYGMSGSDHDEYEFTGGNIRINNELTERLKKKNNLVTIDQVHKYEHSTEVQLPFIKKFLDVESVAVFVYGEISYEEVSYVISDVLEEGRDLVIISTDLSHFYSYDECVEKDRNIIEGLTELNIGKIGKGEACGMTGIKAVTASAVNKGLKPSLLDYRNSGDVSGDRSSVVGYMSAVFI